MVIRELRITDNSCVAYGEVTIRDSFVITGPVEASIEEASMVCVVIPIEEGSKLFVCSPVDMYSIVVFIVENSIPVVKSKIETSFLFK